MRFFLILILIFINHIFSIDTPTEPSLPGSPSLANPDSKKDKKVNSVNVNVKLCDSRIVSGKIEYDKEEILIKHIKNGINYEKKISVSDISQIKILSWNLKKGKKVKEGTLYEAKPEKVFVQLKTNENIQIKTLNQTEFLSLKVSNNNGLAKLFTYWSDLLYDNGNWYSKLSSISGLEREDCHPDVVKQINFE